MTTRTKNERERVEKLRRQLARILLDDYDTKRQYTLPGERQRLTCPMRVAPKPAKPRT